MHPVITNNNCYFINYYYSPKWSCIIVFVYTKPRGGSRIFEGGWLVLSMVERQRCKLLGGSGGMPPGKFWNLRSLKWHFQRFETTLEHSKESYYQTWYTIYFFCYSKGGWLATQSTPPKSAPANQWIAGDKKRSNSVSQNSAGKVITHMERALKLMCKYITSAVWHKHACSRAQLMQ